MKTVKPQILGRCRLRRPADEGRKVLYRATIWMRRAAIKVRMGGSPSPMMIAAGTLGRKQFLLSD
jgi:hypothetical protein